MLPETDTLLAGMIPDHPNRPPALKAISLKDLSLSPYTLIELNSIIRAGKLKVRSLQSFTRAVDRLLSSYEIVVPPDSLKFHAKAWEIEDKYSLTFLTAFMVQQPS